MAAAQDSLAELGVRGRADAETAIASLVEHGELGFVLAVLANAVSVISEADALAGDRVFTAIAARLAGPVGGSRDLYRWSATTFVIVSRSLRKVTGTVDVEGVSTALFAAWPEESPRALFERIDNYIASHMACFEAA